MQTGKSFINKTLSAKRAQAVANHAGGKRHCRRPHHRETPKAIPFSHTPLWKKDGVAVFIASRACNYYRNEISFLSLPDVAKSFHKKGAVRSGKCPF
ncbi:MAG: hypothetical protein V8S95_10430 [Odoribacter sp.]